MQIYEKKFNISMFPNLFCVFLQVETRRERQPKRHRILLILLPLAPIRQYTGDLQGADFPPEGPIGERDAGVADEGYLWDR